jgi:hypothetical protein
MEKVETVCMSCPVGALNAWEESTAVCNRVLTISSQAAPNVWIRNGRSSRDFEHFLGPLGGAEAPCLFRKDPRIQDQTLGFRLFAHGWWGRTEVPIATGVFLDGVMYYWS